MYKLQSYTYIKYLIALFVYNSTYSQDILWEKSYGGKHADFLSDVQPTADYGFILAGSSLSEKTGNKTEAGRGDLDYWIWKMDEKGELKWQKSFGGEGLDLLESIRLTNDGGFILAGTSNSSAGKDKKDDIRGGNDFWIIKLDATGAEEWQKTIGGSGQDDLTTIIECREGGYLIGGSSSSSKSGEKNEEGLGNTDYWFVKISPKGNIEWQRTYGGTYAEYLRSFEQTKDGGFIAGGWSNSSDGDKTDKNNGPGDYWILKLDRKGDIEWQKTYGGDKDDQLFVVHQAFDGNYIIAGSSNSSSSKNKSISNDKGTDFWILKLDPQGESVWQHTYNFGYTDILTSLTENDDHTLLIAGYAQTEVVGKMKKDEAGINDYIALKIDETGEEKWRRSVGSNGRDILKKLIEIRDGSYILAGTSNGSASRDKKSGIGRNDFWVVKLKDKEKPPKKPSPIEAFPNPADNYTNVIVGYEYKRGWATLYDLGGHQLQRFKITERTIPISLGGLPDGIYIVQIGTDVSTDSVKIIKGLSKN